MSPGDKQEQEIVLTEESLDSSEEISSPVVREEEGVVGGELEDTTAGQAGEDKAGHQLGVGEDPVTAHQVNIKVEPSHGLGRHGIF